MRPNNSIQYFIKVPDIISLSNGLCGVLAISFSINHQPMIAALLIGLGGIFDYLDGKVARAYGISSEFGKQLDSLCDLISFILAPAVFAYTSLPDFNMLKQIILMGYVGAGLLRLARFNVTGTFENGKYFEGLPVPFSILIVFSYFFLQKNQSLLWLFLYVIHAFLMLSIIKIRKL